MNGRIVRGDEAQVSVWDRSFLYGDGLFETVRFHRGRPFRWHDHWDRFQEGIQFMRLQLKYAESEIRAAADSVIGHSELDSGMLRIHLSRGVGIRGYSPRGSDQPVMLVVALPLPKLESPSQSSSSLHTASLRLLEGDRVGANKTANKALMIIAQSEAEEHAAWGALLLNSQNHLAETSRGNLFWIESTGRIGTPPIRNAIRSTGILPGITRKVVLELCHSLGIPTHEAVEAHSFLPRQAGCFVTSSGFGIQAIQEVDRMPIPSHPLTAELQNALMELLNRSV